jgi:hypothetical protein
MPATGAAAVSDCEFTNEHPALRVEIETLKKENEDRKEDERRIFERLDGFGQRLSGLEARVLVLVALVGPAITAAILIVAKRVFGVG